MIADHHNVFDATKINLFFVGLIVVCSILGFYIKHLIEKENQ